MRRGARRLKPHISEINARPSAAKPVRHTVISSAGMVMSFPKMAVNPHASTTRWSCR